MDAGADGSPGATDQVIGSALRLEATVLAAGAGVAEGLDRHVADLAREARSTLIRLAVEHEAAAHAGAGGDEENVREATRRAIPDLREGRGGCVVHDVHRDAEGLFESRLPVDVSERRQVRRRGQTTGRLVDQAGHRDSRGFGFRGGVEFASEGRKLHTERLDGLMAHRGLASAHDFEIPKGHGLDEGAADVEAEGEHGGGSG